MSDNDEPDAERRQREEDVAMTQLLQLAGRRPGAAPERTARVHDAVHQAWRANRRRRSIGRGIAGATALLAAAALVVLAVKTGMPGGRPTATPPAPVASAERTEGSPRVSRAVDGRQAVFPVVPGFSMLPDDVIETDSASRIAFRTSDGSSLRLDRASRTRVRSHTLFELADGTLYIATSETSKGLEVRTALGTLRDIGTRFEVRVHDGSLRLRVRSGLVEIHRNGGVIPALAGTETRVTSSGVDRTAVAIYGSEWDWTAALAPSFDIEGRPLAAFLEYVAREQGWTLRYSDAALATAASSIILHGSVRGLRAEPALSVALATSGLEYRLRAGELLVFRPRGPQ